MRNILLAGIVPVLVMTQCGRMIWVGVEYHSDRMVRMGLLLGSIAFLVWASSVYFFRSRHHEQRSQVLHREQAEAHTQTVTRLELIAMAILGVAALVILGIRHYV